MKKKDTVITFISVAALLGLFTIANDQNTAFADTITPQNNQQTTQSIDQHDEQQDNTDNSTNQIEEVDENYSFTQSSEPKYSLTAGAQKALETANIDPKTLSLDQVIELNKIDFSKEKKDRATKWTYSQYTGVAKKLLSQDKRYRVPYFNPKKIKNMPATVTRDAQTGKKASLEIWDSWPVQNAKTGRVVNYKGYQLVIAMMGIPKKNDAHIYLLYNKYNDNNFNHWKCAGPIFGYKATKKDQEWSGSATVNKDGSIQLFYTDVDTREGTNHQKISTVNLKLKINKKKNKITIAKRRYRHVLFEGDGYYYQTYDQWKATNQGADNITMRDAHVISVDGHRYLIFEASTGYSNYQGENQVYNWQNYGGIDKENIENFLKITANDDMKSRGVWANAAIGIIRLNKNENNPKVDKIMPSLVNSLMVSDEIERPNLIFMDGKYYLFATTRLNRGTGDDLWQAADKQIGDNETMLGWVSDHLTYGYKPLNGDAGVLTASVPFNWRTSTYSYYAVPIKGSKDEVLITSYMTNRGFASGPKKRSTLAPSFLLKIKGDTTKVEQIATNQGDWVYDKKSKNNKMLVNNIKNARLKNEPTENSFLQNA